MHMAIFREQEVEMVGSDALLHIAVSVVGALIIVVMVVGQRARSASGHALPSAAVKELAATKAISTTLASDVRKLTRETADVKAETAVRARERIETAALISAAEREIGRRRDLLDERSRRQYDVRRDLALAENELARLGQQAAVIKPPATVTLESYPTPLSKPDDGKEAQFQLKKGRLAFIPMTELLDRFKAAAQSKVERLRSQPELTDSVGPIGGFHLRYTLERYDVPTQTVLETGRGGSYVQLTKYELLPVTSQMGEPVDDALGQQSEFRAKLDTFNPRAWTITIWVYPDSFEEFRKIRKDLYHRGFAVAGRPMPHGVHIGGSPKGSKSAAQ